MKVNEDLLTCGSALLGGGLGSMCGWAWAVTTDASHWRPAPDPLPAFVGGGVVGVAIFMGLSILVVAWRSRR